FGRGALLAVLLGGDGGVGLVGGAVGDGDRLGSGHGIAGADVDQGPVGLDRQLIAGGGVVDAAAQRAARLFGLRLQPPLRRLAAIAPQGVLKLFAQAIAQAVVLRR